MITYSPAKTIASGVNIEYAQVISMYPNIKTSKVSGTIGIYVDQAHMTAGVPVAAYQVPSTAVSSMGVNLIAAVEAAAMAKYSDLAGGTQS